MYYVRTDGGVLTAQVDNVLAGKMLNAIQGSWVVKNFKSGKRSVFVFSEDSTFGNSAFRVAIWKGFYMEQV